MTDYTRPLQQLSRSDEPSFGGKSSNLGELLAAEIPVPPGFAISTAAYQAFVRPFLAANGGRFLVRGGQMELVEGVMSPRVVVIEFPGYEDALRVYRSAEYQEGMKLRLGNSVANIAVVEGFDG